jgi:hypothetical protein
MAGAGADSGISYELQNCDRVSVPYSGVTAVQRCVLWHVGYRYGRYGLDWTVRGSNIGRGNFQHPSRLALGSTQPLIQWVPCLLRRGKIATK